MKEIGPLTGAGSPAATLARWVDIGCVALVLPLSQQWLEAYSDEREWLVGLLAALLFQLLAEFSGFYRSDLPIGLAHRLWTALRLWLICLVGLLMLGFLTRYSDEFARAVVGCWWFGTGLLLVGWRWLAELIGGRMKSTRRCAVAGVNTFALGMVEGLRRSSRQGWELVGFFDDRQIERLPAGWEQHCHLAGDLSDLVQMARRGELDTVLIALPMRAERRIQELIESLRDTTASIYLVPDFFVYELLRARWSFFGGLPAISVVETPMLGVDGLLKRLIDVSLSGVAVLVLSPLLLVLAALVAFTSPGPVFFRQRRYGLDGREIWVWKFRSMRVCEDGANVAQATRHDPRVTLIGGWLRRTSLDELPQLFNVLKGDMSLVGPRPHATAHNEYYRQLIRGYMLRHKVKPGITGLAQVHGCRGETETVEKMQQRVALDHRYIQEWSLVLDIKILIRTLAVVWRQETAY